MSYHRLGALPGFTSTNAFVEAVDPYAMRFLPANNVYSPYGWGPDMNIGMPMNYTHHIGYERTPIPGTRPGLGPMYDVVGQQLQGSYTPDYHDIPFTSRGSVRYVLGQYEGDYQQLGDSGDGLGGPLIVL